MNFIERLQNWGRIVRRAFFKTLVELARDDPRIFLIVGDLGFGQIEPFMKEFPDRFINAGIAEQNMTGLAAGLAHCGKIVFTYSIGNFSTLRCLEQIRNDVCYHNASVCVASVGGGYAYGALGMSHHATEDLAIMRALPNMTVVAPGDLWETEMAVRSIVTRPGPYYIRLNLAPESPIQSLDDGFGLGKARKIFDGHDITLICTGSMLETTVKIARTLKQKGISSRVISMHTVEPIDVDAVLSAARETKAIFSIEEHSVRGGLGSAIAEFLLESDCRPPLFRRIGLPPEYCSNCGNQDYLLKSAGLSEENILELVKKTIDGHEKSPV